MCLHLTILPSARYMPTIACLMDIHYMKYLNYFNDKFCNPKNIYNPKNIKFYMYACAFIFIVSSLGC